MFRRITERFTRPFNDAPLTTRTRMEHLASFNATIAFLLLFVGVGAMVIALILRSPRFLIAWLFFPIPAASMLLMARGWDRAAVGVHAVVLVVTTGYLLIPGSTESVAAPFVRFLEVTPILLLIAIIVALTASDSRTISLTISAASLFLFSLGIWTIVRHGNVGPGGEWPIREVLLVGYGPFLLGVTGSVARLLRSESERFTERVEREVTHRFERRLFESDRRYRDINAATSEGIVVHDGERIYDFNDNLGRLTGYPRETLEEMGFADLLSPDSAQTFRLNRSSVTNAILPVRLQTADGSTVHVEMQTRRFGEGDQLVSALRDVSERVAYEDALRRNLDFLETLLDAIPNPVFLLGSAGDYTECNRAFADLVGAHKHEVLDGYAPRADLFRRLVADREPDVVPRARSHETVFFDTEGSERRLVVTDAPFLSDGRLEGRVAIITDVTQRYRMERELNRAREVAEEASRAKSRFLAHMTHELKTPLNGILGFARSLGEREGIGAAESSRLYMIETNGRVLLNLIEDVLLFSRAEAGAIRLQSERVPLEQLLSEVVSLFEPVAARKGITLTLRLPEPTPTAFHGDSMRVRQILNNLVGNAVRYTASGSIVVEVALGPVVGDETQFRFLVHDTGKGVSDADRERIFTPFYRASEVEPGGTGLGLVVSRELAALMRGRVDLERTSPKGSTFVFEAPLVLEFDGPLRRERSLGEASGVPPSQPGTSAQSIGPVAEQTLSGAAEPEPAGGADPIGPPADGTSGREAPALGIDCEALAPLVAAIEVGDVRKMRRCLDLIELSDVGPDFVQDARRLLDRFQLKELAQLVHDIGCDVSGD